MNFTLTIGGGFGEHGRTCFLVEGEDVSFLLDCGIMAGDAAPYPHLTAAQIKHADFLFLSHSHQDHTGALSWLYENGFCGTVFLSSLTWEQLQYKPQRVVFLEDFSGNAGKGLHVFWGKSGHCPGSVWYRFTQADRSLLFTGDYVEDTLVYQCDRIRGQQADLAILDCAYAKDPATATQNRMAVASFLKEIASSPQKNKLPILLPVPKYGRGLELMALLAEINPTVPIYADDMQIQQWKHQKNASWITKAGAQRLSSITLVPLPAWNPNKPGILLVSDPQLQQEENRILCSRIQDACGIILLTGNQDMGSYSQHLMEQKSARFFRYPVHQNKAEMEALSAKNRFGKIFPFHAPMA